MSYSSEWYLTTPPLGKNTDRCIKTPQAEVKYRIYSAIRQSFFPSKTYPENLNQTLIILLRDRTFPSKNSKIDLEFWSCSEEEPPSYIWIYMVHITGNESLSKIHFAYLAHKQARAANQKNNDRESLTRVLKMIWNKQKIALQSQSYSEIK